MIGRVSMATLFATVALCASPALAQVQATTEQVLFITACRR